MFRPSRPSSGVHVVTKESAAHCNDALFLLCSRQWTNSRFCVSRRCCHARACLNCNMLWVILEIYFKVHIRSLYIWRYLRFCWFIFGSVYDCSECFCWGGIMRQLTLKKIMFFEEATFHVSWKVNKQNLRIWGPEHIHATSNHIWDSPKDNMRCGLLSVHIYSNCRLSCSSSKIASHHTGIWLCVLLL
jgi:hypothetical protein